MKHLQILRHAKSSWRDLSLSDHDRGLNKRGERTAPIMGQRLSQKQIQPQVIISSTAKRAYKTAKIVAHEITYPLSKIITNKNLYHAATTELLDIIAQTNDAVANLMLVGHNPGLTDLANQLCKNDRYFANIPTAGLVTIGLGLDKWQQILNLSKQIDVKLIDYDYPKLVK